MSPVKNTWTTCFWSVKGGWALYHLRFGRSVCKPTHGHWSFKMVLSDIRAIWKRVCSSCSIHIMSGVMGKTFTCSVDIKMVIASCCLTDLMWWSLMMGMILTFGFSYVERWTLTDIKLLSRHLCAIYCWMECRNVHILPNIIFILTMDQINMCNVRG